MRNLILTLLVLFLTSQIQATVIPTISRTIQVQAPPPITPVQKVQTRDLSSVLTQEPKFLVKSSTPAIRTLASEPKTKESGASMQTLVDKISSMMKNGPKADGKPFKKMMKNLHAKKKIHLAGKSKAEKLRIIKKAKAAASAVAKVKKASLLAKKKIADAKRIAAENAKLALAEKLELAHKLAAQKKRAEAARLAAANQKAAAAKKLEEAKR
jgi:colicin import membrane protein